MDFIKIKISSMIYNELNIKFKNISKINNQLGIYLLKS